MNNVRQVLGKITFVFLQSANSANKF